MKVTDNHEATIWLGLREGYTETYHGSQEVAETIQKWCTEKKQCVTMTPTSYIYVDGQEPGLIIGFINYARFPYSKAEIRNRAIELGELLMKRCKQYRISVTFYPTNPGRSMLLENEEMEEK